MASVFVKRVRHRAGEVVGRIKRKVGFGRTVIPELPLRIAGFDDRRTSVPRVELLDDDEMALLNGLLPWKCFTLDSAGRRFGNLAWKGKREDPQRLPDPRIVLLDKCFDLSDKHVLEVGCFEGVHTIALCQFAKSVTAVDSHVANVVKTMVRSGFYGMRPEVFLCNVEQWHHQLDDLRADVLHHVGVLYHLKNPVEHLLELGPLIRHGMLLDTHIAVAEDELETGSFAGVTYRYKYYRDAPGLGKVFSGMYEHAKWLLLDDIVELLRCSGFDDVTVYDRRQERNGPRVSIFARRSSPSGATLPPWPRELSRGA